MHEGLEIGTRFNDWFQRMVEYGFLEGKDFYSKKSKTSEIGGRPSIDYEITVGMAKQICMRDWKLEPNSQSGFQGCVSTVFQ